jgi:hypothetical protein
MLKKLKLFVEAEDLDELQEFRNTKKSGIFRVEAHPAVFPFVDVILWILILLAHHIYWGRPGFNASTMHQQNPNYRPFRKHL